MRVWIVGVITFLSALGTVHAFPEMVRHGYINCTACHVSPAGGGLMSPYGRSMSKEILSRWSYESEENLLNGAIQSAEIHSWINGTRDVGLNIGGDVRYIQLYRNSQVLEQGKFFPMQRDMEAAFRFYRVTVAANYGIQYEPGEDTFDSRRSYVMYQATDELSIRAGRFLPIFGVMVPDHYANFKRGLGFDQGRERDTAEINYIKDRWQATVSFAKSPKSVSDNQEEKAFTGQLNYAFADKYKAGMSYWQGDFEASRRQIYALHSIWGFSHEVYAISEIDYQTTKALATDRTTQALFYFQRVGYEFTRGLHLIGQIDGGKSDLDNNITETFSYGLGLNFYPRPHFEIQSLWSRASVRAIDDKPMDMAHILLHYYF